jgi:kumamolisin
LVNAANQTSVGLVNPTLYAANETSIFRDIVTGNNGAFSASKGWDACTGLGSPIGTAVADLFRGTS